MEPADLAEARQKAEAAELEALEAEAQRDRWRQGKGSAPVAELARLAVEAQLRRQLAFKVYLAYLDLVERSSDPAWQQREQAER